MNVNHRRRKWFDLASQWLTSKLVVDSKQDKSTLDYWKQQIFIIAISVYLFGGIPLMFLGSYLFYQDGLIIYGFVQVTLAIITGIILINKHNSEQSRSFVLLIFLLLVSFAVIFMAALSSAGMILLLATLFLASLLLEPQSLRYFFGLNLLISLYVTIFLYAGYFDSLAIVDYKRVWLLHILVTQTTGIGFSLIVVHMHRNLNHQNQQMMKSIISSQMNQHRFQSAIANSPVPSIVYKESGEIVSLNPSWEKTIGYSLEDMPSLQVWLAHSLQTDKQESQAIFEQLVSTKDNHFDGILTLKTKLGSDIYLAFYTSNIGEDATGSNLLLSVGIDLTEQLKAEELYNSIIETTSDGFFLLDKHGRIMNVNATACTMLGYSKETFIGRFITDFDSGNQHHVRNQLQKVIELKQHRFESTHKRKDGYTLVMDINASVIQTDDLYIFLFIRDVTEKNRQVEEILYISTHDSLTDTYNRHFLQSFLHNLPYDHQPFSLMIFDINGIKLVNDSMGFDHGDFLITEFSSILKQCIKESDIMARSGGSEFMVYVHHSTQEMVKEILDQIRLRIDAFNAQKSKPLEQLSISYGYAHQYQAKNILDLQTKAQQHLTSNKLSEKRSLRNALLNSIVTTLAEKSHETKEHATRLSDLCVAMGEKLHLAEHHISELKILSILHDIGKIGIPESVLNKPGPLTPDEWEVMKKHPEIGYRIALASGELERVANYILCHHERWDGTGYPSGLKEEQIPLHSRILSIVDAYDAMTSDRIYRKGLSHQVAIEELKRHAQSQFDAQLVDIFIEIIDDYIQNNPEN